MKIQRPSRKCSPRTNNSHQIGFIGDRSSSRNSSCRFSQQQHQEQQQQQQHGGSDPATDPDNSFNSIGPADNMLTSKKKLRRRSRMKTLKILHHLLTPGRLITLAILFLCNRMSAEPGYLDFDNLPETNFTCAGKVIGGYYADLETSCQMFHVCTIGQLDEPMDIKFLCLNGTVFDQETRVCERVDEVDCSKSEKFYYLNLELYGNTMVPMPEEGDTGGDGLTAASSTTKQPSSTPSSTTTTTARTTTTKPSSATTKHTNYPQGFNFQQQRNPSYTFNGTGYNYNEPKQSPTTTPHYVSSTLSTRVSSTQSNRTPPSTTAAPPPPPRGNQNHESHSGPDGQLEGDEEGLEEEYEYEDDYVVVTEQSEDQNQKPVKAFSPQQFIFDQNKEKVKHQNTPTKPAISFQQQRFQNNGPSQFATSHQGNNNGQAPSSNNNQQQGQHQSNQNYANGNKYSSNNKNYFIGQAPSSSASSSSSSSNDRDNRPYPSTTTRPSYNNYYPQPEQQQKPPSNQQLPKRIPLLTLGQQQQQQLQNNINFQQQQQLSFRVRGSGFQLPGGPPPPPLSQPRPFAGYQRPPPPQVPLHLPSRSLREQKDLLGFEDVVAESFSTPQERKDSKRSDPGTGGFTAAGNQATRNATTEGYEDEVAAEEGEEENEENEPAVAIQEDNEQSGSQKKDNLKKYSTTFSQQKNQAEQQQQQQQQQKKKAAAVVVESKGPRSYDKTLLIPQERYKSTLPKIIITASASVSANGKKLNYSLGNVLGQGAELKIPPPTYDDYKEEDVVLDPFFQDVPKIKRN